MIMRTNRVGAYKLVHVAVTTGYVLMMLPALALMFAVLVAYMLLWCTMHAVHQVALATIAVVKFLSRFQPQMDPSMSLWPWVGLLALLAALSFAAR